MARLSGPGRSGLENVEDDASADHLDGLLSGEREEVIEEEQRAAARHEAAPAIHPAPVLFALPSPAPIGIPASYTLPRPRRRSDRSRCLPAVLRAGVVSAAEELVEAALELGLHQGELLLRLGDPLRGSVQHSAPSHLVELAAQVCEAQGTDVGAG
jgi:hypothetical protein